MKREASIYINDIIACVENIESFLKGVTKKAFNENIEKQSAVMRQLEIIGEAVKNLPAEITGTYKDIPWKDIAGLRDVMIHSYFQVDIEKVWNIIKQDIPKLKQRILEIKKNMGVN